MSDSTSLLQLIPERSVVRNDEVSEFDLVIEINTVTSNDEPLDAPKDLNLCIVIDRSGSMEGPKLETAKKCCKDILQRLSEKDLFTVVVFDHEATVIINPTTPREQMFNKIESIKPGGRTNLALGWHLGLLELQTYTTDTHINRIILLSDGQANLGETKVSVLGPESARARSLGITTSTIGIGEQFQEDILSALADESGGRFYYIEESKIEDILDEEFQGSLSIKIERPRVALMLPDGVTIKEELNEIRKISNKYHIRPILSNDVFNFAIRIQIDPTKIGSSQLSLKAYLYDAEKEIQAAEETITLGTFNEFVTSEENLLVKSVTQQYKTAKAKEKMIEQIDEGDFDFLKMLIVENVGDMIVVKDKLAEQQIEREQKEHEKNRTLHDIETLQRTLRELGDVQEKLHKSEFMLIFVDMFTYLRDRVQAEEHTPEIRDFLARWRKLLMSELMEEKGRFSINRRIEHDKRYGKEFDYRQQRNMLRLSENMVDELLLKYPDDRMLQYLKVRIHEQLERS